MVLKCGVIGLGRQSVEDHLPALTASDAFQLQCICDVDQQKTDQLASKHTVKGYTSYDSMLDQEELDVVIIAVPHSNYLPIIRKAAERGVHIIKEKPLAVSSQEAKQIYSIINSSQIFMGINSINC